MKSLENQKKRKMPLNFEIDWLSSIEIYSPEEHKVK